MNMHQLSRHEYRTLTLNLTKLNSVRMVSSINWAGTNTGLSQFTKTVLSGFCSASIEPARIPDSHDVSHVVILSNKKMHQLSRHEYRTLTPDTDFRRGRWGGASIEPARIPDSHSSRGIQTTTTECRINWAGTNTGLSPRKKRKTFSITKSINWAGTNTGLSQAFKAKSYAKIYGHQLSRHEYRTLTTLYRIIC